MTAVLDSLARRSAVWAGLVAAALAVRLAVVATAPPTILFTDGRDFEKLGHQLASEHTYGDQPLYAPGYITWIGAVYSVAGRNLTALRVAEAVLSTGTVGLVGAFGASLFFPAAGLLAAALAAFHPVMVLLPVTHYAENLVLFLSALSLGCFGLAVRRPSAARWLPAGSVFGPFELTKPNMVVLLPGLALGAWIQLGRSPATPSAGAALARRARGHHSALARPRRPHPQALVRCHHRREAASSGWATTPRPPAPPSSTPPPPGSSTTSAPAPTRRTASASTTGRGCGRCARIPAARCTAAS